MAKVTIADVQQSNGVIHVIDKVLLPKIRQQPAAAASPRRSPQLRRPA